MKSFLLSALLVLISTLSSSAQASSIADCQGEQFSAVLRAISADSSLARVFSGGFRQLEFDFDDAWETPVIRLAADVPEGAASCEIGFRLETNHPPALGCPVFEALRIGVACADLCKSCGLVLGD